MCSASIKVFTNNMGNKSQPVITKCKESDNWTKVTFKPDLAKFNMTHLEDDVVALMKKRVVDLAGCLGKTVKVELNGQRVPVKSFSDYCDLYLQSEAKTREDPLPRLIIYLFVVNNWNFFSRSHVVIMVNYFTGLWRKLMSDGRSV